MDLVVFHCFQLQIMKQGAGMSWAYGFFSLVLMLKLETAQNGPRYCSVVCIFHRRGMPEPALQAIQELRARRMEVPHHGGNSDLVQSK